MSFSNLLIHLLSFPIRIYKCPVGYSDHTKGIVASPCAVSLGATIIEKHFTLDRKSSGPDHRASLEPSELRKMITNIREVEAMLIGDGVKAPQDTELEVQRLGRRSVVLVKEKKAGEAILGPDVRLLRPATGIPPKFLSAVVGQKLSRDVPADTPLTWEDLESGSPPPPKIVSSASVANAVVTPNGSH